MPYPKKKRPVDGANISIPETNRIDFDDARIYEVRQGFPICDIGVVPEKPQADGEASNIVIKVKFNKAGEAQIECRLQSEDEVERK